MMNTFNWGPPDTTPVIKRYVPLITDECNLNCSYCFQKYKFEAGTKRDGIVMTEAILAEFIKRVFEIDVPKENREEIVFQFCGGEALLYPELVDYGVGLIRTYSEKTNKKVSMSILTNGTLLGNPEVRALFEKHPDLTMCISLDGNRENHQRCRDGFDQIMSNMPWIKEHHAKINKNPKITITISPDTIDHLVESFKFVVDDLKIKGAWIGLVIEDKRWGEDFYVEKLHKQLLSLVDFMMEPRHARTIWNNLFDESLFLPNYGATKVCGAIAGQIVCTPDGTLFPCYVHRNQKVKHDFSLGNVWDWIDEEKEAKVMKCSLENSKGMEECVTCDIGRGCKRCSASFAEEYDTMYEGDMRFCKAHHAKFFAWQYLIQKRQEMINRGRTNHDR